MGTADQMWVIDPEGDPALDSVALIVKTTSLGGVPINYNGVDYVFSPVGVSSAAGNSYEFNITSCV